MDRQSGQIFWKVSTLKLTVFTDHRFRVDSAGVKYSLATMNYDLLASRYLSVFDEVKVVGRVVEDEGGFRAGRNAEGPGMAIASVGNWQGPLQHVRMQRAVNAQIADEIDTAEAVLIVSPGRVGEVASHRLKKQRRPFGIEVIGDPMDVFALGASTHPLRPLIQVWATRALRKQVRAAHSVAYVSRSKLPIRYPASPGAFVTNYSSIDLRPEHFASHPKPSITSNGRISLITVGSLSQPYKGVDVLIDALAYVVQDGFDVSLKVLGEGRYLTDLQIRAELHGLSERVRFLGHLPAGDRVRAALDEADLFVLASRTEGLPRAMIEAMARGLPCIGTNVGGIPELLPAEDLVPAGDAESLARKIKEVISDDVRLASMAERNLKSAGLYQADVLQSRRNEHYSFLKDATLAWLSRREN